MERNENIKCRRWILGHFLIASLMLAVVATFNYRVDSLGLFHPDKGLRYAMRNVLEGRMVAGLLPYHDREFQKMIVENSPSPAEIVVLGSSRSMELRGRFIVTQKTFFNHSVAGATLEDAIAITGVYKVRGRLPNTVILALDPWMFNKNNDTTRWQALMFYYKKMLTEIYGKALNIQRTRRYKYLELINGEYTLLNVKDFKKTRKIKEKRAQYTTTTTEVDDFVREPDGSLHYPLSMRDKKDEALRQAARRYVTKPERYFRDFHALSNLKLFEDFVNYLKGQGTRVVIHLSPFHPVAYEGIKEKFPMVLEAEDYLRDFASKQNILLMGSYDPAKYNFENKDFIDGSHGNEKVAKKIFEGFPL